MLLPCRGAPATVLQTMAVGGWKQHRHHEDTDAYATLSFIVFAVLVVFGFLVILANSGTTFSGTMAIKWTLLPRFETEICSPVRPGPTF